MHYSRVASSPTRAYSAATAVLMNELLKGTISYCIALARTEDPITEKAVRGHGHLKAHHPQSRLSSQSLMRRSRALGGEIFSSDCWKLSIPAILYVIQVSRLCLMQSSRKSSTDLNAE